MAIQGHRHEAVLIADDHVLNAAAVVDHDIGHFSERCPTLKVRGGSDDRTAAENVRG